MANEVEVFELTDTRGSRNIRPVPFLTKQTLSVGGAVSAGFNRSAAAVTVITSLACRLEFGTAPTGSGATFPIAANVPYDFDVIAGTKVIAVAA